MALVLLIEDDRDACELARDALVGAGHEVLLADNGTAGLSIARTRAVDLVITDIFMPTKDGIETILDLRRECPEVKIIAVSGGGVVTNQVDCLGMASELGADFTIRKPFSLTVLLGAVERVLAARESP